MGLMLFEEVEASVPNNSLELSNQKNMGITLMSGGKQKHSFKIFFPPQGKKIDVNLVAS